MTTFPSLLDSLAGALHQDPLEREVPHHRALLDAYTAVLRLDQQFLAQANRPSGSGEGQLESLIDLLVQRLAAGIELSRLLSTTACCHPATGTEDDRTAGDFDGPSSDEHGDDGDSGAEEGFSSCPEDPPGLQCVVRAALHVFDVGSPEAMASWDLVDCLKDLPGQAEGGWAYAELTQSRLAQLMAPYGVFTRKVTGFDGRRPRSYRRQDLLAALPHIAR
ncbi:DUF3631 domain-containing protein [Streptomyces niveus]|uniref:DUF3631 domain-containing protein n=1 Tax=Streptomyces niveus TaxID=193462 RepID=A0ABZ2A1H5_STRNV|nr:DUF3631 domain-containing protein [Streptomyces niveus]